MKTSMFEYCQIVLTKVSFDKNLWQKEYRKALKMLQREEKAKFIDWINHTFKGMSLTT